MNSYQIKTVQGKLARLRDLDECYIVEGAEEHKYYLHPRLSERDLASYEKKMGILLPKDYRNFLKYVGNGGAGPLCGILPLAEWSEARTGEGFDGDGQVMLEQYERDLEQDRQLLLQYHATELFNASGIADLTSRSALSLFALCSRYNISLGLHEGEKYVFYPNYIKPGGLNDYLEQATIPKEYLKGYIPITSAGNLILIVNGHNYGQIFIKGTENTLKNTQKSFLEYYTNWLDNHLANFEHIRLLLGTSLPVEVIAQAQLFNSLQQYTSRHVLASLIGVLIPEGLEDGAELEWLQKQLNRWRQQQKKTAKSKQKTQKPRDFASANTNAEAIEDKAKPQNDDRLQDKNR